MIEGITIAPLPKERIEEFFIYLNDHVSDNGAESSRLFLPISRNNSTISASRIQSFKAGLLLPIDQLGWRRFLIATNQHDKIVGHIDLKSYNRAHTQHRAILGMGVDRNYRQMGLGYLLIQKIVAWALKETRIEIIDLEVLSENIPAIRLYEKCGFTTIGEVKDMFRIDGVVVNHKLMTKKIR